MEDTQKILVVALASALALFLIVAIIATVKVIQILQQLKRITDKAEKLADRAETVSEFFKYTAGPAAIGKLLSNISETVLKHHKKSRED